MWASKVSRSVACAPKLASLPPTTEAFSQNTVPAHLQVAVWRNTMDPDPPTITPTSFGWTQRYGKEMFPTLLPDAVPLVPDALLKVVKCSCGGDSPCKTNTFGCRHANITCSVFCTCSDICACQGDKGCFNERTMQTLEADDDDNND